MRYHVKCLAFIEIIFFSFFVVEVLLDLRNNISYIIRVFTHKMVFKSFLI